MFSFLDIHLTLYHLKEKIISVNINNIVNFNEIWIFWYILPDYWSCKLGLYDLRQFLDLDKVEMLTTMLYSNALKWKLVFHYIFSKNVAECTCVRGLSQILPELFWSNLFCFHTLINVTHTNSTDKNAGSCVKVS